MVEKTKRDKRLDLATIKHFFFSDFLVTMSKVTSSVAFAD